MDSEPDRIAKLPVDDTDLQAVLCVQRPTAEPLLRRARNAPPTAGVKGQTHDGLGVGLGSAQHRPLGYIPQEQGAVLVSSQQERPGTGGGLGEGDGGLVSVRGEEGRRERRQKEVREGGEKPQERRTVQRLSCWELLLTLGGTQQVPFIRPSRAKPSRASSLFPSLHYGTPHRHWCTAAGSRCRRQSSIKQRREKDPD